MLLLVVGIKNSKKYFFIFMSVKGNIAAVVVTQVQTRCYLLGVRLLVNNTVNGITEWMDCSAR